MRQVVGECAPARSVPAVGAGAVHLRQRDAMVDVELARVGDRAAGVGIVPAPGNDTAAIGGHPQRLQALPDRPLGTGKWEELRWGTEGARTCKTRWATVH